MKYHEDFYINRLVKEWLAHEVLIIACDLDDTLFPYNEECTEVCKQVRALLQECETEGTYVIANTAREKSKHSFVIKECSELGIKICGVNQTPEHLNIPFGKDGKVYANIFLDDRSGLELALYHLRVAYETVKEIRNQQKFKDQ